jgi:hypothetical protein
MAILSDKNSTLSDLESSSGRTREKPLSIRFSGGLALPVSILVEHSALRR